MNSITKFYEYKNNLRITWLVLSSLNVKYSLLLMRLVRCDCQLNIVKKILFFYFLSLRSYKIYSLNFNADGGNRKNALFKIRKKAKKAI